MRLQTEALRKLFFILFPLLSLHFCLPFLLLFVQHFRLISSFLSLLFLFPSNLYFPHTFPQHSFVLSPFLHSLNSLLHPYSPHSSSSFLHFFLTCLISSLPVVRTSLFLPSSIFVFVFHYLLPPFFLFILSLSNPLPTYIIYYSFLILTTCRVKILLITLTRVFPGEKTDVAKALLGKQICNTCKANVNNYFFDRSHSEVL